MLKDCVRNDSLLLRLALAEGALPGLGADFARHRTELADRFAAAHRRGDRLHLREEARFALEIERDPARALVLARENWSVQRESADLSILAATATAAHDTQTLREIGEWRQRNRLEDEPLATLLADR